MNNQGLPSNVDVERYVLGGVLVDENTMHAARNTLEPSDFSLEKHRRIWRGSCELYDHGSRVVDRITLAHYLIEQKELESVGGLAYLVDLDTDMPKLFDLNSYVSILKDLAIRRRMIAYADNLEKRLAAREPLEDILQSAAEILTELKPGEYQGAITVETLVEKVGMPELLAPRRAAGVRLPWGPLDKLLCGLHPDHLTCIAAHTSGGKTSAALQIAAHVASQNVPVLVFSLEMSPKSLFRRMVSQRARVGGFDDLDFEQRERVREAAAWLHHAPIYFDEDAHTVATITASIRRVRAGCKLGMVVIDYLQLLCGVGRHESRAVEVGANSRALKLAAKEFHIPFLMLSQFNRESAKDRRKPELFDLKASGDIENDCDNVLFIHPTGDPESTDPCLPVDMIIAKQREGPRNISVKMCFDTRYQRLEMADEVN